MRDASVGGRIEGRVLHPQRLEDLLAREPVERQTADATDDVAEQEEVDVAVDEPLPRLRRGNLVDGERDRRLVSRPHLSQIDVGPQARDMGQKMTDGDVTFAVAFEARDVGGHTIAQSNASLLDQDHDAGGRGDDLGQRGQVEHRVERHRLGVRHERAIADRFLIEDLVAPAHEHDRARQLLLLDRRADERLDRVKTPRVDADLLWGRAPPAPSGVAVIVNCRADSCSAPSAVTSAMKGRRMPRRTTATRIAGMGERIILCRS